MKIYQGTRRGGHVSTTRIKGAKCFIILLASLSMLVSTTTHGIIQQVVGDSLFSDIRSRIKEVPSEYLITVDYEVLPQDVRSRMWADITTVFREGACPWRPGQYSKDVPAGELGIRTFAAMGPAQPDLVEYLWQVRGQPLRVLADRNVMRLVIDINELARNRELDAYGRSLVERVKGLISEVLRCEGDGAYGERYALQLPWPPELKEGVAFSSNPERKPWSLDHAKWYERVDGIVFKSNLSLIIYRKPGSLMQFQDASKWFPDEFRAYVHQKAREQGKLPPEVRERERSSPNQPPP